MQLLPTQFSQAIGWTILHSLWQAMVIAILSAAVMIALRNKKARTRYRVAGLGMLLVLLSAVFTFYWYAPEQQENGATALVQDQVSAETPADETGYSYTPATTEDAAHADMTLGPLEAIGAYFEPHISLIAMLWCLGFAFCFLRLLGNIGYVHYLKTQRNFPADEYWAELKDSLLARAGVRQAVALVESTLVRTPLVVGHLKPYIMFPIGLINRLDPYEVEAILAHEIAHIVRRDYLFNILQSLVETIFYYHPAVWWLSSAMRREREIAADELAIAFTGNAVNYAKALVVVQELAYFPLSPALAFAGERKSQLFTRVQRILHTKNSKSLVMEKFISAGMFLLVVVGLAYTQQFDQRLEDSNALTTPAFTTADSTSGIWQAEVKGNQLCLTLTRGSRNNHWNTFECYKLSDFSPLPSGQGSFTMTREAGTITFSGVFEGKEGYGKFKFQENPAFRGMLREFNIQNIDDDIMIQLCLGNVNRDYLNYLKQKGYDRLDGDDIAGLAIHGVSKSDIDAYSAMASRLGKKDLSIDDMMALKIHDVSEDFVKQLAGMGFKSLSFDDVVAARIHDMEPGYLNELKNMGFNNLSFDDALSFKIHNLDAEFVRGLKEAGFDKLSPDEMLAYRIHDVDAEFVRGLKEAGFDKLSPDEVLAWKIHNVDSAFVEALKKAGLDKLTPDEILAYKIHEVSPEYIQEIKNAGYEVDNDEIQACKIHGITGSYIAELKAAGFTNLSMDEILGFKIHDVTPEYVAGLKKAGISDLDAENIMAFKIHDITPDRIASYRKMGFKDLDTDEILSLRIHDISAAFIESYKPIFDKQLTVDELLSLRIHDVTPEFIRKAREKGFTNMDPDEYVQLKIQFGQKLR